MDTNIASFGRRKRFQLEEHSGFEMNASVVEETSDLEVNSKSSLVRPFQPSESHQNRRLQNTGNSCYLNSVVQALSACFAFTTRCQLMMRVWKTMGRDGFQTQENGDKQKHYMVYSLLNSILTSLLDEDRLIPNRTLFAFRYAIGKIDADFDNDFQHDAHNFLLTLLSSVDNLFETNQKSVGLEKPCDLVNPSDVFNFTSELKTVCQNCKEGTLMEATNNVIYLPVVKDSTMKELLQSIGEWSPLDRRCPYCEFEFASSSERITEFPTSLIVCLKKYETDESVKTVHIVEPLFIMNAAPLGLFKEAVQTELISSHAENLSHPLSSQCTSKDASNFQKIDVILKPAKQYQLVSVVCHIDEGMDKGHYVSYTKDFCDEDVWMRCDDSTVKRVDRETVSSTIRQQGYIFFYDRNGL